MSARFRQAIAIALIVSIAGVAIPLPAQAAMIATQSAASISDRDKVTSFVNRAEVRSQLQALGINPSQVQSRVAALTDDEASQLAARIDTLPAGADAVGAVLGVALLVFIILLITDLLGLTHVFPFVKPIK